MRGMYGRDIHAGYLSAAIRDIVAGFARYARRNRSEHNNLYTIMQNNRVIHALSLIAVVLFCWVIYPYKWIRKALFRVRKRNAVREADQLCRETGKAAYVVQAGTQFYVGNRAQFREWNNKARKGKRRFLDIDYRHALIYKATPHTLQR